MPFENGTVNAAFFVYDGDLPENLVEIFANRRGCDESMITDEPSFGWVNGSRLLDNQITEESISHGSFYYLNLRRAERKIPASYLNALCQLEEHAARVTRQLDFIPKKLKVEIKEDIIDKNLMKMPPSLSGIPVVISPVDKVIIVGASSTAQQDLFVEHFFTATGIEPIPVTPGYLLEKNFQKTEMDVSVIEFAKDIVDDTNIGRDFLTWLWYFSEVEGKVSHADYGDFEVMLEGPLTMSAGGESLGSAETVIKNGEAPQRSAEAKAALLIGKKLKKAKFTVTNYDRIFVGNFDADKFAVSSLHLPEGEKMDDFNRFEERMNNLIIFRAALEAFFNKFIETLFADDIAETQEKIQQWALERDSK